MSDPVIEQIKERIDIVELLQEYIPLMKAGGNWRALCPFHNEKTPSFMVSQEKQIWHCFGCNKGGDIFTFVQEIEGGEFGEVLRKFADRTGITLPRRQARAGERHDRLLHIIGEAKQFYEHTLHTSSEAEGARRYLESRSITPESQKQFGLGYSFDDWRRLRTYLAERHYDLSDMIATGLIIQQPGEQNAYDRFRGRLMIPLVDHHGTVVGFTARSLQQDEPGGKYINSPQSEIYDKSKLVFGLAQSKVAIKQQNAAIVVEGNFDVITAHHAGITNVVATSGTAFTVEQIRLLKRYTQQIILAFDMDEAGRKAVERSVELAWQENMDVKVVILPEGFKDPDECIRAQPELFKTTLKQARGVMEWWFEQVLTPLDMKKIDDKKIATKQLLPIIAKLPSSVERAHYLQTLADLLGVAPHLLQEELQYLKPKAALSPLRKEEDAKPTPEKKSRITLLTRQVIALAFSVPDQFSYVAEYLDPAFLTDEVTADLYKRMFDHYNRAGQFIIDEYLREHPEDNDTLNQLELQRTAYFPEADAKELQTELVSGIRELHRAFIQRRLGELEIALRNAETNKNIEEAEQLLHELHLLAQQLTELSR